MFRYPKLLALGSGALSATGFAPLELWPVTLACFALLIELLRRAPTLRSVFVRGWLFGLGQFTVGLNWIAHAFTYQDTMPHWFGYGAVVVLSLYLAVYPGLAGVIACLAFKHLPAARGTGSYLPHTEAPQWHHPGIASLTALFAAAWIATEWGRATIFTGFAWNPLAAIWVPVGGAAGFATVLGTYGLSGLTILAAGALLEAATLRTWRSLAAAAVMLSILLIHRPGRSVPGDLLVRIVQPNVGQEEKYDQAAVVANLERLVQLSGPPRDDRPRLLLWPESAIDNGFLLQEEPGLRRFLVRALGRNDMLLTGGVALEYDRAGRSIGARNSVFAMGPDTRIHARYDKAHLVPYGEYLPMRAILTPLGLSRLVPGDLDFWPGPGPKTLDVPGIGLVGFQICYEIIFSGQVIDPERRPRFLFNPSNDAWFGAWGPPQHMAQARLRAVEEGMTIVRATPTGISGVIAPNGQLIARIGQGERAVLDATLPEARTPTPFARYGNLLPALFALALAGLGVVIRLRSR